MRPLLAVAFAVLVAGCTAEEGGMRFQRGEAPPEPYFAEHRETVSGAHAKRFDVPVQAQANVVNVTVALDARTHGLPLPEVAPAQLSVRLLGPDGAAVREATLDMRAPEASLVAEALAPGLYKLEVKGNGFSQDLDGRTYGAGYVVTIDIAYG